MNPQLPDKLTGLRLRIRYQHASLTVTHRQVKVRIVHFPGAPIRVAPGDRGMVMKEGEEVEMNLATRELSGYGDVRYRSAETDMHVL